MRVFSIITILIFFSGCSKLRWISSPKKAPEDDRNYKVFMSSYLEDLNNMPSPKVKTSKNSRSKKRKSKK